MRARLRPRWLTAARHARRRPPSPRASWRRGTRADCSSPFPPGACPDARRRCPRGRARLNPRAGVRLSSLSSCSLSSPLSSPLGARTGGSPPGDETVIQPPFLLRPSYARAGGCGCSMGHSRSAWRAGHQSELIEQADALSSRATPEVARRGPCGRTARVERVRAAGRALPSRQRHCEARGGGRSCARARTARVSFTSGSLFPAAAREEGERPRARARGGGGAVARRREGRAVARRHFTRARNDNTPWAAGAAGGSPAAFRIGDFIRPGAIIGLADDQFPARAAHVWRGRHGERERQIESSIVRAAVPSAVPAHSLRAYPFRVILKGRAPAHQHFAVAARRHNARRVLCAADDNPARRAHRDLRPPG